MALSHEATSPVHDEATTMSKGTYAQMPSEAAQTELETLVPTKYGQVTQTASTGGRGAGVENYMRNARIQTAKKIYSVLSIQLLITVSRGTARPPRQHAPPPRESCCRSRGCEARR